PNTRCQALAQCSLCNARALKGLDNPPPVRQFRTSCRAKNALATALRRPLAGFWAYPVGPPAAPGPPWPSYESLTTPRLVRANRAGTSLVQPSQRHFLERCGTRSTAERSWRG